MDAKEQLSLALRKTIAQAFEGVDSPQDITNFLEVPPDTAMGDYAFPCFRLSKPLRRGPAQIAQELSSAWQDHELARAEQVGGYLNFFLNRQNFIKGITEKVLSEGDRYGSKKLPGKKMVVIDYSSINIAKRFHIGHLSTTVIGAALARIYTFLGWDVLRLNYLGDWGTQFGKMIAAYKRWGSKEMIEEGGVQALSDLYVRFHQEAEENPSLDEEGRVWFKKIEEGDPEALTIFEHFKAMTLKDAKKVYQVLGVEFDSYQGESFYNDKMDPVIEELREKSLLIESDGAEVVMLEEENLPPCLILKSDGATLYSTRDITSALYRKKHYGFDKNLYVVAYQQTLHFQQVFAVLEKMGYGWAKDQCEHVAFGMVSYEGEALSTRRGNVIYLDELLEKAQEKALDILEEKNPDMADKDTVARQVGVGAVVFSTLFNQRIKDIDFWWDKALNFDGETGPYVQYTYARIQTLLEKGRDITAVADYDQLTDDESQQLALAISRFPEAVENALNRNEPYLVTRQVVEIAKTYNKFYYEHRILTDNLGEASARLNLSRAAAQVIQIGLGLIGVETPKEM